MTGISSPNELGSSAFEWIGVLSDPARARLLILLERAELSVGELCRIIGSPQSTISRHLKALADNGWLGVRRDGTSRFYNFALADQSEDRQLLWRLVRQSAAEARWVGEDECQLQLVLQERQTRSQAFFASAADRWAAVRGSLFGEHFHQRLLLAMLDPGYTVADLGCGTGELSALLASHVAHVEAIDCSPAMIEAARERLRQASNVRLQVGDITRLPLGTASVDIALLVLVMHTLQDPRLALQEAARTLKPNGRLIIVDLQPHDETSFRTEMGHQWLGFDEPQIRTWLESSGVEPLEHSRLLRDPLAKGPPLFLAAGRQRKPTQAPEGSRGHQVTAS